jgi:hypothetical protein
METTTAMEAAGMVMATVAGVKVAGVDRRSRSGRGWEGVKGVSSGVGIGRRRRRERRRRRRLDGPT